MFPALFYRVVRSTDLRLLAKFAWNVGVRGALSVRKFKQRSRRGIYFPPFLHLSLINSCNLRCQGCWVDVDAPREMLDLELMSRTIREAQRHGNSFFGLLGGEPLLHPRLFELLAAHRDCYFQLFTNGHALTPETTERFRALGNVSPLISIEGLTKVSDERRGKPDVFRKSIQGLENCIRSRLLTGVATSLCRSNIDELLTEAWLRELIGRGVHYVWYYAYRPVGPDPNYQLALEPEQLSRVREFIVEMRSRMPIAILETYYDQHGNALCPMATGISHHVSPRGEIEPCPVIQFATNSIRDSGGVYEVMTRSAFLADFRKTAVGALRGCIVLERPDLIRELVRKHNARDTTSRQTALAELERMQPRFSQWLPGKEIPERHWMYFLAKKFFFNDFGAYARAPHDVEAKARQLKMHLDQSCGSGKIQKQAAVTS